LSYNWTVTVLNIVEETLSAKFSLTCCHVFKGNSFTIFGYKGLYQAIGQSKHIPWSTTTTQE